jgi:hypothetical protein
MQRYGIPALSIGLLAMGAAGGASATTLFYTGTLTLQFGYDTPGSATTAGTVGAVSVGGHLSTLVFTGGELGPITTSLPLTSAATDNSVRLTGVANLSGTMASLSGGPPAGGAMGLSGMAKICLGIGPCSGAFIGVPLTPTGTPAAGMGIGGTQRFTTGTLVHTTYSVTDLIPPPVAYTLHHMPWTIGQPVMTFHHPNSSSYTPLLPGGFAHGPASLTSSTARPSGALQLVTVSKVFTSLTSSYPELRQVAVLTLHFVPEPGMPLLFGSGLAALAVLGRRR